MAWQPIDTAPKVSDYGAAAATVLLYGQVLGVRTGRAAVYPDGYVFAGVSNMNGNLADLDDRVVTHWMPLPDPPPDAL